MEKTASKKAIKSAMRQHGSIAYRQGQVKGIEILEWVVSLQKHAEQFPPDVRASYRSDQAFINGMLDVLGECLEGALSSTGSKVRDAIRESIVLDFFDNAEAALERFKTRVKESGYPIPKPSR